MSEHVEHERDPKGIRLRVTKGWLLQLVQAVKDGRTKIKLTDIVEGWTGSADELAAAIRADPREEF